MNEDKDKYVFNIKTVQSGAFRVLIESLKEILTDTNIIFDKSGIKLIATDTSQIVLIHIVQILKILNIFTRKENNYWRKYDEYV